MQVRRPFFPWERPTGEPTYADNQGGHSIWYQWTATEDGLCTVTATGGNFSVLINVCVGSVVSNLTSLANNAMGLPGPVPFQAARGTVYHISLDGYFGEEGLITWSLALHPHNDEFAGRMWINATHFEIIASPIGASLEPGEAALSGSDAVSLWYAWTPSISAPATISVIGTEGLSRLAVFTGSSLANLQLVAQSGATFTANPAVSFAAAEGTQYQIGLFCPAGASAQVRLVLDQLVPRITSPPDGATFPAPARVTLAAQFANATNQTGEMRFYVNDTLLGAASAPPYTLAWDNIAAGTYKIRAFWVSGEQTNSTLPITILVYSNNIMPVPRIFGGAFGTYSYIINAVGLLSVLGSPASQFGLTDTQMYYYPRLAIGPAAVRRWRLIGAGSNQIFWNVPYSGWDFFSWGLTEDGELYRNGTDLIAPPQGVTAWLDVFAASGTCFAVGDDGKLYLGGATPIETAAQGIAWKKVAVAQYSFATLSSAGVGYVHGRGVFGEPVSTELHFPSNVTEWIDLQSTANQFWFLGNNQQLYTSGGAQMTSLSRPAGVEHWTRFAAGGLHCLAIADNGQLYAWGRNYEGQLGTNGPSMEVAAPIKIPLPPGVTAWSAVAAGYMHSLAIGNDCSLYCWGANDNGQLGIGPVVQQPQPVRVANVGVLCGTPVIYSDGSLTRLDDGSIQLRFSSDLNRSYYVQYTDDMVEWKTTLPALVGTGGILEWIDDGPPKTDTHPQTVPTRVYRVVFAP
jgi:hypothetical protein